MLGIIASMRTFCPNDLRDTRCEIRMAGMARYEFGKARPLTIEPLTTGVPHDPIRIARSFIAARIRGRDRRRGI